MGLGAALVSGWVIVAAAAEPSDRLPSGPRASRECW